MSAFSRAAAILRTHGWKGLVQRAAGRAQADLAAFAARRAERKAWREFLSSVRTGPVFFPRHQAPIVSFVIVIDDNSLDVAGCLNSLLRQLDSTPCEVIVVDNESGAPTRGFLNSCSGIRVIRNERRISFGSCMLSAAETAAGRYIEILDARAIVTPGWLAPLVNVLQSDPTIGAVTSQIRDCNGLVRSAGGVAWRDGSTTPFGEGRHPSHPAVAFPRDVDDAGIVSLMVRTALLRDAAAHAATFARAGAISLSMCLALQAQGHRIRYEPRSVVLYTAKSMPGRNDADTACLAPLLTEHPERGTVSIDRAARRRTRGTILVMDSFIPFDDRSAGARRMFAIMRMMRESGWHVIFVAHDGGRYEPYTARAQQAGIEVLPHRGGAEHVLRSLNVQVDVAWVARPDILVRYLDDLRSVVKAPIIYDTVDLHFLRQRRQEALLRAASNQWEAMRSTELSLARAAEVTVVTSYAEARELEGEGISAIVVPIIEKRSEIRASYSARRDLLFLGNYTHEPNVDAVEWLTRSLMPRVWARMPDLRVVLAGADPTPSVLRLASDRVEIPGYVADVAALFNRARLFVAPLRYGAGMKGKVIQSLSFGLPSVITSIAAEGVGIVDGMDAIVRDDEQRFADAIVELYNDEVAWKSISEQAYKSAWRFDPSNISASVEAALRAALEKHRQIRVDDRRPSHPAEKVVEGAQDVI